jgi:radical SAM protein with 4Fe4S-binding SPASM domain
MDTCEYKPKPLNSYEDFMVEKYWKRKRPSEIHFELTQKCNLRCAHCMFTHESLDELSTEEVFSVLLELKKLGVLNLSLSGGEIFMRKDIVRILDFILEHRFLLVIYTNGTLLTPHHIEKIAALRPQNVDISVYGATADVHDAITLVKGSFDKTIRNIKALRESGVKVVFKGFLLRSNFHQRREMVELANSLNVLYSFDYKMIPMEAGHLANLSEGLTIEQIKQIYYEVDREGLVLRNNVKIISRDNQLPPGGNVICNGGIVNGCISAGGDVYPCPVLRMKLGNIRDESFEKIWATDEIDPLRYMRREDLKTCIACSALEFCNRCPGVAYLETGDYLGPAPAAVCSIHKALASEVERR